MYNRTDTPCGIFSFSTSFISYKINSYLRENNIGNDPHYAYPQIFAFIKTMIRSTLIIVLLIGNLVFAQNTPVYSPSRIISNPTFITATDLAKFNSEESLEKCGEILKKMRSENRSYEQATPKELSILQNCEETKESPWEVIGGGCNWYCGGFVDSIYSSSNLPPQGKYNYEPENLHDWDYRTPWIEGVDGYGIGESIIYEFVASNPRITNIIIVNGFTLNENSWFENSRVKKLKVYLNNEEFAILDLKDTKNDQVFVFDPIGLRGSEDYEVLKTMPNWTLKFEIIEVYEGDVYEDTAITEIYFDGIDVH